MRIFSSNSLWSCIQEAFSESFFLQHSSPALPFVLHDVSTIGSVSVLSVKGGKTATLSNQSLVFWRWRQNFRAKHAASRPHNVIDSCTIPHLIRTHFSQTFRGSERVKTGDRLAKRQDIRSSCEPCNRTIVVTSVREWQQCSHPAPPQCCRSACSCILTTCGLLGHVMALLCQDRDRDCSRSGNSGSPGAIHTNRAVSFRKLSGVTIKNCMLDVAVTSRVPATK